MMMTGVCHTPGFTKKESLQTKGVCRIWGANLQCPAVPRDQMLISSFCSLLKAVFSKLCPDEPEASYHFREASCNYRRVLFILLSV